MKFCYVLCPTLSPQFSEKTFLLVQSSSIEPKCFGSGFVVSLRRELRRTLSRTATSPEPAQDIKIAIGGYHATLMYEEIASTDDGTPSGFTRRRGKSREVTVHLKGECASAVLEANR